MPPARLATKSVCEAIGVKPAEVEMVVVEDDVLVVVVNAAWSQCLVPVRTISSNLLPVEVETVVEKVIPGRNEGRCICCRVGRLRTNDNR